MPSAYRRILSPQYLFPLVTASWRNKRILFYLLVHFSRPRVKEFGYQNGCLSEHRKRRVIPCSSLLTYLDERLQTSITIVWRLMRLPASPTWPELFCPGWATLFVWRKVMVPFPSLLHLSPSPPLRTPWRVKLTAVVSIVTPKKNRRTWRARKGEEQTLKLKGRFSLIIICSTK